MLEKYTYTYLYTYPLDFPLLLNLTSHERPVLLPAVYFILPAIVVLSSLSISVRLILNDL